MTISTAFANTSLDASFTGMFVGLLVSGTEVSATGYVRKAVTFGAAAAAAKANSVAVEWDAALSSWGTITHYALFGAVSGGAALVTVPLTAAILVGTGDLATLAVGTVSATLTGT